MQLEPHFRCADGTLKKPDLLIKTGSRVAIVEVAMHWEGPSPLSGSYHHKVATCNNEIFLSAVRSSFSDDVQVAVHGLLVGARGAWCDLNKVACELLQPSQR